MTYKINSNYAIRDENNVIVSHTITIIREDKYTFLERTIQGEHSTKTDDELIQLVLEELYQDTFFNRAEKEQITTLKQQNALSKGSIIELTEFVQNLATFVGYTENHDESEG